jgi:hypothetical protein
LFGVFIISVIVVVWRRFIFREESACGLIEEIETFRWCFIIVAPFSNSGLVVVEGFRWFIIIEVRLERRCFFNWIVTVFFLVV